MKDNTRECIVITGVTGKLGSRFVKCLLENNYNVLGISRSTLDLEKLGLSEAAQVGENKFFGIETDLTQEDIANAVVSKIQEHKLSPIALINNARDINNLKVNYDGSTTRYSFQQENLLNVVVPYELSLALYNNFISLRTIINIGSIYGIVAMNRNLYEDKYRSAPIHYGVSKAAIIQLTKELAVRFSERNVAVNCLSLAGVAGRVNKSFQDRYSELCPYGKMLDENEVLHHILYMVSGDFKGMTGQNLIVDGGWTVW